MPPTKREPRQGRFSSIGAKKRASGALGFADIIRSREADRRSKRNWKDRDIAEARAKKPLASQAAIDAFKANKAMTQALIADAEPQRLVAAFDSLTEEHRARIKALAHGEDDEPVQFTRSRP